MPPRFIKVTEPDPLSKNIILNVRRAEDGRVFGRLIAMTITHAGPTPVTTADDPEIAEAISLASSSAATAGADISVLDPHDLWQSTWGHLETR